MQGYKTHVQSGILLNANEASQNVNETVKQEIIDAISNLSLNRYPCLLYTSPSPRDRQKSRMPSSA